MSEKFPKHIPPSRPDPTRPQPPKPDSPRPQPSRPEPIRPQGPSEPLKAPEPRPERKGDPPGF